MLPPLNRYCTDRAELANLYVHLTNVAIQKKANDYDKEVGCKWDLRSLKVRENLPPNKTNISWKPNLHVFNVSCYFVPTKISEEC